MTHSFTRPEYNEKGKFWIFYHMYNNNQIDTIIRDWETGAWAAYFYYKKQYKDLKYNPLL